MITISLHIDKKKFRSEQPNFFVPFFALYCHLLGRKSTWSDLVRPRDHDGRKKAKKY